MIWCWKEELVIFFKMEAKLNSLQHQDILGTVMLCQLSLCQQMEKRYLRLMKDMKIFLNG